MPLQNRVTPEGELIACRERGTMMGNRGGALHGPDRSIGQRRWVSRQWICCRLQFKGRHRQVMAPGRYTELFFLDEATALAAGHRPCFECRREEARHFAELWAAAHGSTGIVRAGDIDARLHAERLDEHGAKRTHTETLRRLPDGAIIVGRDRGGAVRPMLVLGDTLLAWSPGGYTGGYTASEPIQADRQVEVLTPPGTIAVLRNGYRPMLHETAHRPP